MDELHKLQQPRTDSSAELSFILLSQVKELLFHMVFVELSQARRHLCDDSVLRALRDLDRAARTQRVLIASWDRMNAMSADEFLGFREVLGEASGTQSFMYRSLEFIMGNKDRRLVSGAMLRQYPRLAEALAAPSVYDETLAFLARRGYNVPSIVLKRDPAQLYTADPGIEKVWLEIYRSPDEHADAHRLAESLIEVSYQFSRWRSTHLLVVERMLGTKPGTGGTEGVSWLRKISEHRFFPELWSVRSLL